MSNLFALLNIASMVAANQMARFSDFLYHGVADDISFAQENNIDGRDDYEQYFEDEIGVGKASLAKSKGDGDGASISAAIGDVRKYLNTNYPDYLWVLNDDESALTSDVSNHVPIDMKSNEFFPRKDIEQAVINAGVQDKTTYGGCGPIAALGIMDYFARYLGYDEIIEKPNDKDSRIKLATEVFSNTYYSIFGNQNNTLVWPRDCSGCFNTIMANHGLSSIISAKDERTLFGGQQSNYWNKIVENIDEGLPVTLCVGNASGEGEFAKHYTNIYGYETWVGISNENSEKITKTFIKAKLNYGWDNGYYCDADILNNAQVGIITYNLNYSNRYSFYSSDFAEEFVNDNGGGQYFFYPKQENVCLSNGMILQTNRLRTSYIENQYLVLSPKREGAGSAYLDITFPSPVSKFSFTASMWSDSEGAINENFFIQYYDAGRNTQIITDPYEISTIKNYPDKFKLLFPKDTNRIRFYAQHSNPTGDKNKGRICLDNFVVEYN